MLKKTGIHAGPKLLWLLGLPLMMLQGCLKKDLEELGQSWAPGLAAPLLDASLGFENILSQDSTYLRMNPDKSLYLYYSNSLPSRTAESLISIPDQDFSSSFNMDNTTIIIYQAAPGRFTPPIPVDSLPFSFSNNARIDNLEFKSGTLNISMESDFTDSVEFRLSIPSLKNKVTNAPFEAVFDLNYANGKTLPLRSVANANLSAYYLDLSANKIAAQAELSFKYLGGTTQPTDSIKYSISFSNVRYSYIDGYVGQIGFSLPTDSINFNLFNNAYTGNVMLTDPRIKVVITNSYGIPININLNRFEAELADGTRDTIGTRNRVLAYPLSRNDPPQVDSSLSFNKTNSNLVSVLARKPKKLIYGLSATGNPDTVNKQPNFVKDTSSFKVAIETRVPLELTISGLVIQDTFPGFTFTEEEIKRVESLKFKLTTVNGFPIDVGVQVYFCDENYTKLDSLITPYQEILSSAIVPAGGGRATAGPPRITAFTIEKDRARKLTNVKHILAKGVIGTYKNGTVPSKFYADYKLSMKVGMIANFKPLQK
jgi:hypothetical protein